MDEQSHNSHDLKTESDSPNLDQVTAWVARLIRNALEPDLCSNTGSQPGQPDWLQVEHCLRANRLLSILPAQLLQNGSAALQAAHRHERTKTRLLNLRVLATGRLICEALLRHDIAVLVIKGPLQQERVFGTLFRRASSDVDLWVRPADRIRAGAIVETLGFERHADCDSLWWRLFLGEAHYISPGPNYCEVDLHHSLHQAGLPRPARPDRFFERACKARHNGGASILPSSSHAFLITCLALGKGLLAGEPVGHYAMEIAATCKRGEAGWCETVWHAAREQRLVRLVSLCIGLCEQAFGIDLRMGQEPCAWRLPQRAVRILLLSADSKLWSRRKLIWQMCDGSGGARWRRFGVTYGRNIAGQLCQRWIHAPHRKTGQTAPLPAPSAPRQHTTSKKPNSA